MAEPGRCCLSRSAQLACLSAPVSASLPRPAPPPSSVGTFARALDCSSSVRQPSLHMSAAAASRDITLVRGLLRPARPPGRALGALVWQPRLHTGSG